MFQLIQQTPESCQFSGDPLMAFDVLKEFFQKHKGRIKTAKPSTGELDVRFRYGINPFGLRIRTQIQNDGDNLHTLTIAGDFVDAIDTFGAAEKKAQEVLTAFVPVLLRYQPAPAPEPIPAPALAPVVAPASTTNPKIITTFDARKPASTPAQTASLVSPSNNAIAFTPAMAVSTNLVTPRNWVGQWGALTNTGFFKWFALLNGGLALAGLWTAGVGLLLPFIGLAGVLLMLPLSRFLAKRAHGVELVGPKDARYPQLYSMVEVLARQAGLPCTPEVGVYNSADMNAFATGSGPQSSIVAFSSALLEKLSPVEVQAVAAHEIGHIVSRDMLAMAVLQGMISSVVIACSWPLQIMRGINLFSDSFSLTIEWLLWIAKVVIVCFLTILGNLVLMSYSRHREYRADAMAALLVSKEAMMSALKTLSTETEEPPLGQAAFNAMKISTPAHWLEWFSSHPRPEDRIQALNQETYMRLASH